MKTKKKAPTPIKKRDSKRRATSMSQRPQSHSHSRTVTRTRNLKSKAADIRDHLPVVPFGTVAVPATPTPAAISDTSAIVVSFPSVAQLNAMTASRESEFTELQDLVTPLDYTEVGLDSDYATLIDNWNVQNAKKAKAEREVAEAKTVRDALGIQIIAQQTALSGQKKVAVNGFVATIVTGHGAAKIDPVLLVKYNVPVAVVKAATVQGAEYQYLKVTAPEDQDQSVEAAA